MTLRDELLNLKDFTTKAVQVEEWGRAVLVRTLTAADMAKVKSITDEVAATVALVCLAVCDEDGNRVFKDADAEALKAKAWSAVSKIALAALTHNGQTAEAVDDAKKD